MSRLSNARTITATSFAGDQLTRYRVVAHDRRGHARSTQVDTGNDMGCYGSDASVTIASRSASSARIISITSSRRCNCRGAR
jgi:pimeloyl-ACP methyl ester carboxylesterase